MGYQVRTIDGQLTIPRDKHAAAAAAVLKALGWDEGALPDEETLEAGNALDLGEDFSDPDTKLLINLLAYAGFQPDEAYNAESGTLAIDFYNDKQTAELDETGRALAPFVADGQYLIWLGEEGETWRWFYKDGEFYEQMPQISWPEVPAKKEA